LFVFYFHPDSYNKYTNSKIKRGAGFDIGETGSREQRTAEGKKERKEEEIVAKRRFRDSGKGRNSINGKKCDGFQARGGKFWEFSDMGC
jgi:hypothetical protein